MSFYKVTLAPRIWCNFGMLKLAEEGSIS